MEGELITLAVQKTGRLSEKSLALMQECGVAFENSGKEKLVSMAANFPLQLLFLRDDDIPECVADRIADIGIVGENVVAEKQRDVEIIERLGFGRCRLSIALPRGIDYTGPAGLQGKKIATSYPNILSGYLKRHRVEAIIHEINGSVEIAPGIGLADAIFDIVSTGSTLISNGLREVEQVMTSEAVVIAAPKQEADKQRLIDQLLFRMRSVRKAAQNKYILLNAPNDKIDEIIALLPGMKSPTVMPLALGGWSSLHSVIREDLFWEIIEKLKQHGAEGILVLSIEKMID
jgi:ATP phosphoribosyltransferase